MALTILLGLLSVILIAFFIVYFHFKKSYTYWKKRNIKYLEPSFPFGNIRDVMFQKMHSALKFQDFYKQFKHHGYVGVYSITRPNLILCDPELIKDVLIKNFDHFHDRGTYFDEEGDPLMAHLFMISGARWKNLREKLSPTFTSGKMKMMFQIFVECGNELTKYLQEPAEKGELSEFKDLLARFNTDIIASFAFGIQCNCLKYPNAEFRQWGRRIFKTNLLTALRDVFTFACPPLAAVLKIPFVPKDVTKYFQNMVKETVQYRENNNVSRNDFLQLLIQLKNKGSVVLQNEEEDAEQTKYMKGELKGENIEFTMKDLAAQSFVFFVAGFETSSTTMSYCLYELALNPNVQETLQHEIDTVLKKHQGIISYDAIQEMAYLEKVISETLRKHPPVLFLVRECTKPYTIPGTKTEIEKGTLLIIPNYALHHDEEHFPNPERFDPERFNTENTAKRHNIVYLPFGEGPRFCIGKRLGLLQTKVGIAILLSKYSVHVCEKTPIPLKIDPRPIINTSVGGMWLKVVKRN